MCPEKMENLRWKEMDWIINIDGTRKKEGGGQK